MARGHSELAILLAMSLGVLMQGIDGSIVNVALPDIAQDFGTDTGMISWVTIVYFMMLAGTLLPFGRIADSGNIRKVFLIGFSVFTVGSLFCGISPSFEALFASRVVQGLGAAMMASSAPMICVKMLPRPKLGRSLGVMTLASASGYAVGPALGGVLVDLMSWHWIFLINVPIGVLAILFGHYALPSEPHTERVHVDVRGALTLFLGVVLIVFAVERLTAPDAMLQVVAAGVLGVLVLVLFGYFESISPRPILDVRLFLNLSLDSILVSLMLINLVYMGVLYILPFYMDLELGVSTTVSGMVLLIPSLVTLATSTPIGKMSDRRGRRGFAIAASAVMILFSGLLMFVRPEWGIAPVAVATFLMGVTWGLCGATSSGRVVDNCPEEYKGIGSALMNFFLNIGSAVGTALFAAFLTMGSGSAGMSVEDLTTEAFMSGMHYAMLWAVLFSVISVLTAWVVNEKKRARVAAQETRRARTPGAGRP